MPRKIEEITEAQAIRQMNSEPEQSSVLPEVDQENAAPPPRTRSAAKSSTVGDQMLKLRSDNIPSKSPSNSFKAPPTHDPQEESPSAIFWLNDDCLLEVMKYLPLKDVVNLLEADPRFRNAVEMRITNNEVDFHVENEFWNLPRFLEVFSKTVSILYLDMDSESELLRKFHHFENLERLVMTGKLKLSKFKVSELPTNFESLAIDGLEARNETPLKKWLRRLDPTLKKLEISYNLDYWDLVGELHNLESLSIMTEYSYPENLMENLKQNTKLRKLHLNSIQLADYPDLDQLTQLESLIIEEVNFFSWDELLKVPHKNLKILSVSRPKHFYLPSFKEITREFKKKLPELQFFIMDD